MTEVNFSQDQMSALRALESGMNVFLTGKAGTGKTKVVNEFIDRSIKKHKNIIVCAPTGAAAQRITATKACTIHRAFGLSKSSIVTLPTKARKEIAAADVIVIDEISMCRIDLFEHVVKSVELADKFNADRELRLAGKERRNPTFKKIQLVVIGDFLQLEPVLTNADKGIFKKYYKNKLFAFESRYWDESNFINVELTTIHRQKEDKEYAEALNNARDGTDPIGCADWFNYNTADKAFDGPDTVILCGKNKTAAKKNMQRLNAIKGDEYESIAKLTGDADIASTNAEYDLKYKIGAKVMMLTNGPGYFNGSSGMIVDHYGSGDNETVVVMMDDGHEASIKKYKWDVVKPVLKIRKVKYEELNPEAGEKVEKEREEEYIETESVGCVAQFPFKLGWAITIHKSQGMTFKCPVILYPEFFANGQMYVALSRVDSGRNIYINGLLDYRDARVSPKVLMFYDNLSTVLNGDSDDGYTN